MKVFFRCLLCLSFFSAFAQQPKATNTNNFQESQYYWIYKGYMAVENGKYKEAIFYYTKSIQSDSTFVEAFRYRGTAYCFLKNYIEALADFDRAIKLDPEDGASYNSRGAIYEELKIPKLAIRDYQKAVQLHPHNKKYLENLSNALDKEEEKKRIDK